RLDVERLRLALRAVGRRVELGVAIRPLGRTDEARLGDDELHRLAVPDGSVAVAKCDLRDSEEPRRSPRAQLVDEDAVTRVAPQIAAEVGPAEPNYPAGGEHTTALLEHVEDITDREVLRHVLEEDRGGGAIRERDPAAQIPVDVRLHPEHVDVHPPFER